MASSNAVASHYTHGRLLDAILAGVERLGKSPDTVSIDDLGPVDEFHIGGRAATESFLDQVDISADDHVLDVGCGLGGASRFVAERYGCHITGVDLTHEYIETARVICVWLGLEDRITLEQGDATAMSYADGVFDKAYMMHVGMNIPDKRALLSEIYRVLRPDGVLAIYDIMQTSPGTLTFPVPWAASEETNAVATPEAYKEALDAAGFRIVAERDRRDFALDFFARLQASAAAAEGPPPLGLHILMGETAPVKIRNMVENISANRIAPVELIAEKKV